VQQSLERVYTHFSILAERRSQLAGTLSGGEQQMLAIGRALMARPRLILLGRAIVGAGAQIGGGDLPHRSRYPGGGATVLLVEQNANKALSIADYGYVLETGKIALEGGEPTAPANDHVRRLYLGH